MYKGMLAFNTMGKLVMILDEGENKFKTHTVQEGILKDGIFKKAIGRSFKYQINRTDLRNIETLKPIE